MLTNKFHFADVTMTAKAMMRPQSQLGALLVLLSSVMSIVSSSIEQQCSLYIAPSTIPNAGLGIFTAIPLEPGENIGHGDVMIPIVDMDLYMRGKYSWMIGNYTWEGESCGMAHESSRAGGVTGFGPGLDGAINCNLALINVDSTLSQWDDVGFHRSRNAGAGAFSPYFNASTFAKTNIPAGGELFKFYGDAWFRFRRSDFGLIPLSDDYTRANQLLQRFHTLFMTSESLSDKLKRSLYDFITTLPFEGRTLNALPPYDNISQAVATRIESLHQKGAMRSIHELETVGRCLDNIRPDRSTLPEAGRGAFATKHLSAGSVITGSPLLHIADSEMFVMHEIEWNEDIFDYVANTSQLIGYQLLLNYCWGHAESTVLLCPYGAGVSFINHNQSRANVAIRWAPEGQISHNSTWLQLTSVNEMKREFSAKLAIDFIALRDIEPGEELFLDYGQEWEDAWSRHVLLWEQELELRTTYLPAAQYNLYQGDTPIRTIEEQRNDPYPENLELRCHQQAYEYNAVQCLQSHVEWEPGDIGYECDILERIPIRDEFVYFVTLRDQEGTTKNVSGISRDFFAFSDRPYTTDMHLPWAFRHKMMIPDDMFPQIWKTPAASVNHL
jgi:hypothetical protein